jgi:hypothetical protein
LVSAGEEQFRDSKLVGNSYLNLTQSLRINRKNESWKEVNPKWQIKIKQSNAKIAVKTLRGPRQSRNSTKKKVSTHQFVVKNAVLKHVLLLTTETEEAVVERENLSL